MSSADSIPFDSCGRLPEPGDNVAIATRRLDAGTVVAMGDGDFEVRHTVLEGHRFAPAPIAKGQPLLSWGLPFGDAVIDIEPGEYLCNERILQALAERDIDFALPEAANFADRFERYEVDPASLQPGCQVSLAGVPGTFRGYRRAGERGVGTRNFLAILGLTSNDAPLVETIATRCRESFDLAGCDGIVALAHTEGAAATRPNNLDLVLRTLAGFIVHPNIGAVLVVDHGVGSYSSNDLRDFMQRNGYAIDAVPHEFLSVQEDFEAAIARAVEVVRGFVPQVAACVRTEEPLAGLRIALQCGGSDAFSGVSGNSLAGWVAKEVIRNGGGASLAETDELIGAEPYVLANVRDGAVAAKFLDKVERFKELAGYHGASAEGNPSGGNNYRGLYNIALKSLGAARKKDPEVRLDEVLEYAEPMTDGGFYFMDSPGNDLESIAGQVASGCNLILFITGNGSITNFPFVPTLKFVTTTARFELLSDEMDVNAGRYNDGMPMDELGRETFELAKKAASGEPTKGELAGHSQLSIWRDWRQSDGSRLESLRAQPRPDGRPLALGRVDPVDLSVQAYATEEGSSSDLVGLIMPTSLCSGQVAGLIADHLNARQERPGGLSRFVALAHTEGCGSANADHLYLETLLGHLRHPFTRRALLLEHGCEKTHNDAIRVFLDQNGESPTRYGFASVQLDGGIEAVREQVVQWFDESLKTAPVPRRQAFDASALRLGVLTHSPVEAEVARALAAVCGGIAGAGGTVVLPDNTPLLEVGEFRSELLADPDSCAATLAYGERASQPGLHVMHAPTEDQSEVMTGLGGTGVELMLAHVGSHVLQGHPMIPLLQVSAAQALTGARAEDLDLAIPAAQDAATTSAQLLERIGATASGSYRPRLFGAGNVRFQLTRGQLGVSL